MSQIIAFAREKTGDKLVTVVNLSAQAVDVKLATAHDQGRYQDVFSGKTCQFRGDDRGRWPNGST